LRQSAGELERGRKLLLCSSEGERSAAAAFILVKLGFDAFALQGGFAALNRHRARPTTWRRSR